MIIDFTKPDGCDAVGRYRVHMIMGQDKVLIENAETHLSFWFKLKPENGHAVIMESNFSEIFHYIVVAGFETGKFKSDEKVSCLTYPEGATVRFAMPGNA